MVGDDAEGPRNLRALSVLLPDSREMVARMPANASVS